ncbi:MAG: NAD-dependent epimerase/dehydratase family protein [Acidobacteriota bacterium]
MHVFVTGAGGFLGQHLSRVLVERGARVTASYLGHPPQLTDVALVELDVCDRAATARAIAAARPDVVVHLAGLSHVGESWQRVPESFRVNVLGTEHVVDAATAAGGARVVFASSAEVYGMVPETEQPISEDRELDPRTPYALSKAAAERLALRAGASVVRTFNLVGPGQAPNFALPAFARQLRSIERGEQEPVLRVGNLAARRDFVHVLDGAEAYRLVIESGTAGGVYNLASGHALSIGGMLERLIAVAGRTVRVETDPARFRPVDLPLSCGDARRLGALGWRPRRTPEDALRDLWESLA